MIAGVTPSRGDSRAIAAKARHRSSREQRIEMEKKRSRLGMLVQGTKGMVRTNEDPAGGRGGGGGFGEKEGQEGDGSPNQIGGAICR